MLQTSSTTRSSNNLLLLIDVTESDKVDDSGGGHREDGTVERSPCSKNLNGATGYLIPDARQAFT